MNKKIVNNVLLLLYPLLLLLGVWRYQTVIEEAMRTFEAPSIHLIVMEVVFFLLLGLFLYYFVADKQDFHILFLMIGMTELAILLLLGCFVVSGGRLYTILSGKEFVFGTVLTIYLVLLVRQR